MIKIKKGLKLLVEVLHSKEIEDFINKEYKGAVVPGKRIIAEKGLVYAGPFL